MITTRTHHGQGRGFTIAFMVGYFHQFCLAFCFTSSPFHIAPDEASGGWAGLAVVGIVRGNEG